MRIHALLCAGVIACGDPSAMSGDAGSDSGSGSGSGSGSAGDGLVVSGNHIVYVSTGLNFHGRGANLHDTRSCNACSFAPADPAGLNRWSDELTDVWHANLVRFLLSSKAAPFNQSEVQWKNLVDDPAYLSDIVTNVTHLTAKPGVYVLVTLFADPTIKDNNGEFDSEWPSSLGDSNTRYTALAEALVDDSHVLFGLTNEPHTDTTAHEADLATRTSTRSARFARSKMRMASRITSSSPRRRSATRAMCRTSSPIRSPAIRSRTRSIRTIIRSTSWRTSRRRARACR
jgi:hypothetical protein